MNDMEKFIRIAMARLKKTYPFRPQRRAVAAKMYMEWLKRKEHGARKHLFN